MITIHNIAPLAHKYLCEKLGDYWFTIVHDDTPNTFRVTINKDVSVFHRCGADYVIMEYDDNEALLHNNEFSTLEIT